MLEGVRASGDLRRLLLEMAVEQRFCNRGDKCVEVVFTFPLPWGAVLMGVDVLLGGKRLTGRTHAESGGSKGFAYPASALPLLQYNVYIKSQRATPCQPR